MATESNQRLDVYGDTKNTQRCFLLKIGYSAAAGIENSNYF